MTLKGAPDVLNLILHFHTALSKTFNPLLTSPALVGFMKMVFFWESISFQTHYWDGRPKVAVNRSWCIFLNSEAKPCSTWFWIRWKNHTGLVWAAKHGFAWSFESGFAEVLRLDLLELRNLDASIICRRALARSLVQSEDQSWDFCLWVRLTTVWIIREEKKGIFPPAKY